VLIEADLVVMQMDFTLVYHVEINNHRLGAFNICDVFIHLVYFSTFLRLGTVPGREFIG
jgi:hypothetical protein